MRIAITNPTNWPQVRRGTERFINELARFLAGRGHEVTVLSTHPGHRTSNFSDGYRTVMQQSLWRPWMERKGVLEFHVFFLNMLFTLPRHRFDVVLCCTFMDAFAATLARKVTGTPCIFWVNGLPPPIQYFRSRSMKGAIFGRAIRRADEVVALSSYMRERLQQRFGRGGIQCPVPVDLDKFVLSRHRNLSNPRILCTAALDDRRKGGRVLMRAFNQLKQSEPRAILQLSCNLTEQLRTEFLSLVEARWRGDVQFLGAGALQDLPALVGSAAATVLPSRWEAFGLVILESLATGTPVAATRDGALPEIITDRAVGRLFDPGPDGEPEPANAEGLATAILQCLELSRDPRTPDRCRDHAAQYSWPRLGPRFENLLADVAGRRKFAAHPARTAV